MIIFAWKITTTTSRWLHLEIRRDSGQPTGDFELIVLLNILNPSLIYSHQTQKESIFLLKRFKKVLHTGVLIAICPSLRDYWNQWTVRLRVPKRLYKIFKTLPCGMPSACAISPVKIRQSEDTRFLTLLHICLSVASSWRPDLASSS